MAWTVHSERSLYRDSWVDVRTAEVALPDGQRLDHRFVRCADGAHAAVVVRDTVLLIWRHRFITDTWGWEIPGGAVEPGESPADAAAREIEEETGWRPGTLRPLVRMQPMPGLNTARHHLFRGDSASYVGPPTHSWESDRVVWTPLDEVPDLIDKGDIVESTTLVAMLWLLARAGAHGSR